MTIFVDTTKCDRVNLSALSGDMSEIVNKELCGAEDVVTQLRWLNDGQKFEAEPLANTNQLVYLMEGNGVINLEGKEYDAKTGAGIFLGPDEEASITQTGPDETKIMHLIVPIIEGR